MNGAHRRRPNRHFNGRIEKRLPTLVPVYLASLEEPRSRERTLTENVSPHGARVISQRFWQSGEESLITPLTGEFRQVGRVDCGLPTHITSHRSESRASSKKTSSTSCPRFSPKLPRNLNPSSDLSTIRHGNIFWTPLNVMTRLAPFFVTIRLDRRRPWIGELGIDLPFAPVYGLR